MSEKNTILNSKFGVVGINVIPYLIVGLFGLVIAVCRFGDSALLVSQHETEAKYVGDMLQANSGLNYFIQDKWRFPLLKIPQMAFEEGGGNAINTDSLPLMAILAKVVYQLHPKLYDYQSLWLVFCYVMQGIALVWVVSLRRRLNWLSYLSIGLFGLCVPVLFFRSGHIPLCSHFLIIFSVGAYLLGRDHWRKGTYLFIGLIFISLLVTAYLFAIVFGFFAVHLLQGCLDDRERIRRAVISMGLVLGGVILVGILVGYWEFGRYVSVSGGFGLYSMNLLSPLWPYLSLFFDVSPGIIDATGGQYEGMNYLGLGLLVLSLIVLVKERRSLLRIGRIHLLFLMYLLFLLMFALSHEVWIGHLNVVNIDLNKHIYYMLSNFRSGGRMFWGIIYSLIAWVLIRGLSYSLNWRLLVLGLGIVQLIEVTPFFANGAHFGGELSEEERESNDEWKALMSRHQRVYLHPANAETYQYGKELVVYEKFVYLASTLNKGISTAYLNRRFTSESGKEITNRVILNGMDEDALYILLNPMGLADAVMLAGGFDYIQRFDHGYMVSRQFGEILEQNRLNVFEEISKYFKIRKTHFETSESGNGFKYLWGVNGLGHDGSYLDSTEAGLRIPVGISNEKRGLIVLKLKTDVYCLSSIPERNVSFYCGGQKIREISFNLENRNNVDVELEIPYELFSENGLCEVSWKFERNPSPSELGEGDDTRRFGLYLRSFSVEERESLDADLFEMTYGACESCLGHELIVGALDTDLQGTWTDSKEAGMVLFFDQKPRGAVVSIQIDGMVFGRGSFEERILQFHVNGTVVGEEIFNEEVGFDRSIQIIVPKSLISEDGILTLKWSFDSDESPKELGVNKDIRRLGLYVRSFSVTSLSAH